MAAMKGLLKEMWLTLPALQKRPSAEKKRRKKLSRKS